MKQVGDVGALRRRAGLATVIARTLKNPNFFFAVASMAAAFFSLLFALSWGDVSLVAPAAASLTFIGNAVAAKIFLHERVDRRRWIAASLVAAGGGRLGGENVGKARARSPEKTQPKLTGELSAHIPYPPPPAATESPVCREC